MTDATKKLGGQTLVMSGADVERAFDWESAIAALRTGYSAPSNEEMFPPRAMARGDGVWLRTMTGLLPDGSYMGAKHIIANPRGGCVSYLIPLFDQQTVELVALIDANAITGYRTAATTALALGALAAQGAISVGVLGTGFEARKHIRALATIRKISALSVFSPNPKSRAACAEDLADLGLEISLVDSAEKLVRSAPDILICAARSRDETPLFDGCWLSPGMTVASIGSTLPEQREVDSKTIACAAQIIADMPDEIIHDTGDMLAAMAEGIDVETKVVSLSDIISGRVAGRTASEQILLYKSVGGALQDLTVAAMCFERALEQGFGIRIDAPTKPNFK